MPLIGVNTWVWASPLTDGELAVLAPRIKEWGFDLVELPVERPGDWDPAKAAELLEELGLLATVVLVMPPGRELVAADTIAETQNYLRHCVDVAVTVGSPVIGGPAYASVGRTWRMSYGERQAAYAELRENLGPVGAYAAERGVTVAVEPLNRYETSLLNTVEQALEALDGLPGVGLALDVYHLNIEERDPAAAIRAAGERLAHLQVCANDRGAPGADHLDWPALKAAVEAAGYEGPWVIESFTAHNRTIATAASIWRPLAESQDALAVDGLAFLRALIG
ncbi:sugar phosphate isomerase/epimerase family protein [Nonomuraea sp. NPDC050556]|uniref:sugar phosphate isomerase/epimerase family protein n=1 Tax=Nonomuraea sp. NPDC050556 TaxID=3364369 RepID=UPI00378E25D7